MTVPESPVRSPVRRGSHSLALDGLRGLAVLAVVAFHAGVLPFGWLGVPVFFVLSGHFITRILLERRTGDRAADFRTFLRNRALRLAPLYVLACAALSALAATGRPHQLAGDLPYLWTWTYDLRPLFPGYTDNDLYDHLWSLGVEAQLYLLWAALALLLPRKAFVRTLLVLAVGGPVVRVLGWAAMSAFGYDHGHLVVATYELPTTYLDTFAVGALTALPEVRRRLERPARVLWLVLGIVVVVGVFEFALLLRQPGPVTRHLHFPIGFPWQLAWVWGYPLVAALTGAVVLCCLNGLPGTKALSWRPLAWAGLISYGVYVGHRPVLDAIGHLFPAAGPVLTLAAAIAGAAVSLALATVSYRWFELPFITRKRNALSPAKLTP